MIEHKVFCLNSCGLKSPKKFFAIIEKCYKLASGTLFILCIQESKIPALSRSHETVLEQYKLRYHLVPAINCSGGLVTVWSEELKTDNQILQSRDHSGINFTELNLTVFNVYLNTSSYCEKLKQLSSNLSKLNTERSIVLAGDFNAFSHDSRNTSTALRSVDDRVKRFVKLQTVTEHALLFDAAVELDVLDFTHYDKRTSSFSRIDYFFTNQTQYSEMKVHRSNFSDHMLLELSNKSEEKERGQSFWKMNDAILFPNKEYIKTEIEAFGMNCLTHESYEELKCHIRDVCQALAINKSKILSSQMKNILAEEKRLREQIQNHDSNEKILKRYNDTVSKINAYDNNKQKDQFIHFKKLTQSCELGNAKDLKTWAKQKNNTNNITSLRVGASVTTNQEEIIKVFENHFSQLYKSKKKGSFEIFLDHLNERKNEATNDVNEITIDEVLKAINKLNAKSSPGSDGITSNFYKIFKREMAPLLQSVFNNIVRTEKVPESQNIAILKLLPKTDNPRTVDEFRPISLLNTDLKILSHILSARIIIDLEDIIGQHQHAYLSKRQIHIALNKVRKAHKQLNNSKCLVNLDFSKAFDKVDRDYIFALLDKIGIDQYTKSAIRTVYNETKAIIEINGYLSKTIVLQRGVRQGCPLSALLFILAVEPLLCCIDNSPHIKGFTSSKTVAYADDITCSIRISSIEGLFDTVKDFCDCTQLEINVKKSEILSTRDIAFYKTVRVTKILGIKFFTDKSSTNLLDLIKTQIAIYMRFISRSKTLKAKRQIIETFILPKFLYYSRHTDTTVNILTNVQKLINNLLKTGDKMEIRSEVLYQSVAVGGISLPHITSKIISAKLIDEINSSNENDVSFPNDLTILLKSLKLKVSQTDNSILLFKNNIETSLRLNKALRTSEIYWYIIAQVFPTSFIEDRLNKSVIKYNCSTKELTLFSKNIWKFYKLLPQQQNLLYRLAFNCLVDKQIRWMKNFSESPICSYCEKEFETSEHLILKCEQLSGARSTLRLNSWRDVFVNMKVETLRFTASVLNGSWQETPEQTKNYLKFVLNL